ncbi:MAG: CvpA family protein [Chloroflexota bacterium]|nr:CvpA family protein [Chloroflexota bacterium]
MPLNVVDLVLLVILAGAFLLGFFQGAIRQLLGLLAWLISFLLAANLRDPVGDFLGRYWTFFPSGYNQMLAFGLVFIVLFVIVNILTQVRYRRAVIHSRMTVLDEIIGGLLGALLAVLIVTTAIIVLDSYYARGGTGGTADVAWIGQTYRALTDSRIAASLHASLIPGLLAILGPLLPPEVRDVAR